MKSHFGIALVLCAAAASAATYEVGPGRALETVGAVPWARLEAGDTVLIHWREEPYREKFVICRQGAAGKPITVRGVPGPDGRLPVLHGEDAVTAPGLRYGNEPRGFIKIGGASTPADTMPRYIVVENLEIRSARPPFKFTGAGGSVSSYADNAAAMYIEKGEDIKVRNCILRDSGNGLFIGSLDTAPTRNVLIEGNHIFDNGNEGRIYEHNSYTEAVGIVFQFNRYGPLREGAGGNNLKDRSAGLVVRFNWIESGNRQLDLVDAGGNALVNGDPSYRETFVYGNILVEPDGAGNRQIVHYGGDSTSQDGYRKGTLFFYHNTIVSTRTDRTTLLRLSTADERCDARNNIIFATAAGNTVSLLDASGTLDFGYNWIKPAWLRSFSNPGAAVNRTGELIETADPQFVGLAQQDFRLMPHAPARTGAGPLHTSIPAEHRWLRPHMGALGSLRER
jgi:hypothetical protein